MKSGARALGVAESYRDETSTLAGAVVRADRVVDDLVFSTCAVGGSDATDAIAGLVATLDRPDVGYVLVAGIAPAWFNVVDLHALHAAVDRPALSVSFEDSPGLGAAIHREFEGDARDARLAVYERQPARRELTVNDEQVWVRAVGVDDGETAEVVRAFTPEGGRPEPLRVARLAARAADRFRTDS
ncbi:DUF99 family protein [Halorarius litoreus]|uniref:endonuclease dU n=1 Tax=Halorarius litoreus TaxID=2962676 RepID=UPI0020CE24CF|nr:DUF99 family protein [Halorarius litoreus]